MLLLTAGLTGAASFLNSLFWELDFAILGFYHSVSEAVGAVLSPIMYVISLTGKGGYLLMAVSIVMMFFKKTRRTGICCLAGIMIGALFTNLTIKPLVQRPRPYDFDKVNVKLWWESLGRWMDVEHDFSFPSGHVTAAAAGMGAICFMRGRRWIWPAAGVVLVMMFARNYLMAHFPSDVIAAVLIGVFSAWVAYLITMQIFAFFSTRKKGDKLADFVMHYNVPVPAWLTYKGKH